MELSTHLSFNGQCAEAFRFYEEHLGGKTVFTMKYRDSPDASHMPPGWGDKIIHATFALGDRTFSGADAPGEHHRKPQGFAMSLDIREPAEADRVFQALAENATVQMPIQETFWALRFGMLVDQFGIPWMINCGKPQS